MNHEAKIKALSSVVCKNPSGGSKKLCLICTENKKCRIAEKSEEQLDYVHSSIEESVFLRACPGSGKTEVIGLKAAYEIKRWEKTPSGIAIMTFTNNSAEVITDRVYQFAGADKVGFPHFIGTIDSWLHGYIAHPFAHKKTGYEGKGADRSFRLINEDETPRQGEKSFLYAYKLKTSYVYLDQNNSCKLLPIFANNIRWEGEWEIKNPLSSHNEYISLHDFCSSDAFEAYRNMPDNDGKTKTWLTEDIVSRGFKKSKEIFNRQGFATYHDIERICFEMLSQNDQLVTLLSKRFPLVIVDECQDLSVIQLLILNALKEKGTSLHFVGDLDQAIYDFKKVDPTVVKNYTDDHYFRFMPLSKNYRSCQPIIDLCQTLVPFTRKVQSGIQKKVDVPSICISYPNGRISELSDWFSKYLESQSIDHKKSKIVTRGWSNVSKLRSTGRNNLKLPQLWLATALYLWSTGEKQSLPEAIRLMGMFITKKYLDGYARSSKGYYFPEGAESMMEWRLFLADTLERCNQDGDISNLNNTWKKWAAAVRSKLSGIINQAAPLLKSAHADLVSKFDGKIEFRALQNEGNTKVTNTLQSKPSNNTDIKITTIHDVKGETFDAIMVVSSLDKRGTTDGHWEHWLEDASNEAARLAYVASSRPRHLLVWAIPEVDDTQKKRIEDIGFQFSDIGV